LAVKKKVPQRQCTGCGEMKNKKELIRILKTNEDTIIIDLTGKKNGRGAYLCPSMTCLAKVIKNKGLERSLKVPVPEEVYGQLTKELTEFGAK
jgi:predicted RNA-binding protein YlxR (DUF448 family)